MTNAIASTTWSAINALRDRLTARGSPTVQQAAQGFAEDLLKTFPTIVLARVFLVVPLERLPLPDRERAERVAASASASGLLTVKTPVLSLLGTSGIEPAWCDRNLSSGHLAIPLLNREFVRGAPMIAKLLADLEVNLAGLDDGSAIATRKLVGGVNNAFFVPDAESAVDQRGTHVIPARDFVEKRAVRTVFGMGGAYVDGTLAVAIVFTTERLDRIVVDRFPSLIGNFKMATGDLLGQGRIY